MPTVTWKRMGELADINPLLWAVVSSCPEIADCLFV